MMKSIKKAISTALCALFVSLGIMSAGAFPSTAAGLPAKFQPDIKTPVLDQKNNPLCWAYSGSDLLSINAIKNGYAKNGASVFSAPIMARAEFDGNEHRYTRYAWYKSYGGFDYALMAGTTGKGLARADDYKTVNSADAAPVSALYPGVAYIDNIRTLDADEISKKERTEIIKRWIYEYGAVSAAVFVGDYNSVTGVARILPYDNTKPSHAILLVGWDDTKFTDTGTGAFLLKNSWGEKWGSGGYAWVSYNSDFGRTMHAASVVVDPDARVLSHTEIIYLSGSSASEKDGKYGAVNVFDVKEKMTLEYAGTYTNGPDTEFEVDIWVNLSNVSGVTNKTPDAKAKLSAGEAGFYTLKLDRKLEVKPGDKVTALYLTKYDGKYRTYSEYSDPDFEMAVTQAKPGQSYTLSGGELKERNYNFIGTVIGFTEHKEPPVTEAETTEKATEPETTVPRTETEEQTEPEPVTAVTETDPGVIIIPVTEESGPDETAETETAAAETEAETATAAQPEETIDTGALFNGVKKVIKTVLIIATAVVILFIILVLALIAASKRKKV